MKINERKLMNWLREYVIIVSKDGADIKKIMLRELEEVFKK